MVADGVPSSIQSADFFAFKPLISLKIRGQRSSPLEIEAVHREVNRACVRFAPVKYVINTHSHWITPMAMPGCMTLLQRLRPVKIRWSDYPQGSGSSSGGYL